MEAEAVVEEKCREMDSKLFKIEDYINVSGNDLELYTEEVELNDWSMPLKGMYQKYNAALAGLVVSKTLLNDDLKTISNGIKNVIKNTGLQGRFEYYSHNPDIIFDSAHNPEGIQNFLSEFTKEIDKYSRRILLFGVMRDKSIKEMLLNLREYFDEIHVTQMNFERSAKVEEILKISGEIKLDVIPENDSVNFIMEFSKQNVKNCLVVMGSMYLLGEIKTFLKGNKIA